MKPAAKRTQERSREVPSDGAEGRSAGKQSRIVLRPFADPDFESIYEIDQQCYPPEMAYSRREFYWYMRLPGAEGIVAESRGQIAGFILTALFDRTGHIITIDVLPEFRRARVGSALLRAAEDSLARRGAKAIELETAVNNSAAIKFWTRSGYLTRGILKNYYPGGLAAYAMMKHLDV